MSHEIDRRAYEQTDNDRRQQLEIEKLIGEEEDAKVRLQLMILNRINLALIANTNVTNSIRHDLDKHIEDFSKRTNAYDAAINKGIGAWSIANKILSAALVAVQVVFGALYMTIRDDIRIIRSDTSATMVEQAKRSSRIDTLEQTVGYLVSGAAKK
jgi:hypothetical protein